MSEPNEFGGYDDNVDGQEAGQQETGKGLRKQLEKALAEKKELSDKLTELETFKAKSEKESFLKDAGVDEDLFELYQGEATKEAVDAWVAKYGEKLGVSTGGTEESAEAEGMREAQKASALGGAPPAVQESTLADLRAKVRSGEISEGELDKQVNAMFKR